MKIHLVHDEKIINRAIFLFESAFPGNNLFLVFTHKKVLKHITERDNVMLYNKFDYSNLGENDSIIIHNLNRRKMKFVEKHVPTNVPVYWIIWGVDLYNKLLAPKGMKIMAHHNSYLEKGNLWRKIYAPFRKMQEISNAKRTVSFVQRRVNYLVTDTTDNDYKIFTEYYPSMKNKPHKDFSYYPIDEILDDELLHAEINDNNIQIGNSCSYTNNHEYAMEIL
ncbi:MAG: hypothetical protein WCR45_11430, partial [Bacteroidaceae bacterium]